MLVPFSNQARNQDYWKDYKSNCSTGALFPVNHTADLETAESVFTLTNSVPLKNGFREEIWNVVEIKTKENMDKYCRDNNDNIVAYVLTGAIPSKAKLNNRVNIPSYVWTAFCCYNKTEASWVSKTFKAENKATNVNVTFQDLQRLQDFLKRQLKVNVELFNNNCNVDASEFRHRNLQNQRLRYMRMCVRATRQRSSFFLKCLKMFPFLRQQVKERKDHKIQMHWLLRHSMHASDDRVYFLD